MLTKTEDCSELLIANRRPVLNPLLRLVTFDQLFGFAAAYYFSQPAVSAPLEKIMEDFAEFIQRLLEIQSGGRQRSPELIAEDERLTDGLQKRNLAGKPPQMVRLGQDSPEQTRFKA